jgi:hypothetical protein
MTSIHFFVVFVIKSSFALLLPPMVKNANDNND